MMDMSSQIPYATFPQRLFDLIQIQPHPARFALLFKMPLASNFLDVRNILLPRSFLNEFEHRPYSKGLQNSHPCWAQTMYPLESRNVGIDGSGKELVEVAIGCACAALLTAVARFVSRGFYAQGFGFDDWTIAVSTVRHHSSPNP